MPVFISYKHTDREVALAVNEHLYRNGIKTYIDVLDVESQTTNQITSVITKNLLECSHLIAVVSEQTSSSWWVPFEIGEATISQRRICTFNTGRARLPEYLLEWPIMTNQNHLNFFIAQYKNERVSVSDLKLKSRESPHRQFYTATAGITPDKFHRALKQSITRGY